MAVTELYGSESIHEAILKSVTQIAGAVIVYNAIVDPEAFDNRLIKSGAAPEDILYETLPELSYEETSIRLWAKSCGLLYQGISLGSERRDGLEEHVDMPHVSPFAISIGIRGIAKYFVQSREANAKTPTNQFDPNLPVDDFLQHPGDVVFVTGAPNSSIHKVEAVEDPSARIFIATSIPA